MRSLAAVFAGAAAALAGCAAGPDYHRPDLALPAAWTPEAPWHAAAPADGADKGAWWTVFGDAELDALEARALADNPGLALAAARLAQARATASATSAGLFPQVSLAARAQRFRISANRPLAKYDSQNFSTVQDDLTLGATASYELDLAGRVSRSVEGARATADQAAADLANTRLLVSAELAADWFSLCTLDASLDVLDRGVALQRHALELVTARHDLGASSGVEVAQQQALVDATLTQLEVQRRQRAQFEHAIATLAGAPAPGFSIAPAVRRMTVPQIPLGVPSDLLQRRPDVAAAERAMAAANAQVGVARSAYYPSVFLAPTIGEESRTLGTLFDAPSLVWSIGVSATQALFDGGRVRASIEAARAGYDAAVASYRRTVLGAMQEVEDGITGVATMDRATAQALVAARSAQRVLDLAEARFEGGASAYLDVIAAQQALLNAQLQAAQLAGQRQLAATFLVKALGGGWEAGAGAASAAASASPS